MTRDNGTRRAKARGSAHSETNRPGQRLELDAFDKRLIDILRVNARTNNKTIATLIDLSPSAALARLRKLESSKVILGYTALVAGDVAGVKRRHLVEVELECCNPETQGKFESLLRADAEVDAAARVAGRFDYLLQMSPDGVDAWPRLAEAAAAVGVAIRDARLVSIVEPVKGALGV